MRRPLIEKPIRHAPRHPPQSPRPFRRAAGGVAAHQHTTSAAKPRARVALLSAPPEARIFTTQRQRLLDDLGGVYSGHAVHIRDIDDWDTWDPWDEETAEIDYAAVTELLK